MKAKVIKTQTELDGIIEALKKVLDIRIKEGKEINMVIIDNDPIRIDSIIFEI